MRMFIVFLIATLFPANAVALQEAVCAGVADDISASHGARAVRQDLPTFVYIGWPSQADVDSLTLYVSMILPLYGELGGPAAYTGVVEIAYDPNYAGYSTSLKRIRLPYRASLASIQALTTLIHEFSHMWRDVHCIWYSTIEEGLAGATTHEVMERLPAYYWNYFSNRGRRENASITEDIANRPEVGAVNGYWSRHTGLGLTRYAMADWLMARLAAQRQDFLIVFQEEILARDAQDSTFTQTPARVVGLLRELVPAVDGVPFDVFWGSSYLPNLNPPLGDQIFVRGDLIGCYSIRRDGWNEVGYAGIPVDWEAHDRFGNLLGEGTISTGTKGQAFVTLTTTYRGRIAVHFVSHMPNGTQETTVGYWYGGNGLYPYAGLGLFGLVEADAGDVILETLDRTESYSAPIDHGQFSCPSLEGRDGAFRLTWAGRERIIRKDTAPYLVLLSEGTTTPVGIADVSAPTIAFSVACAPNPFFSTVRITASRPLQDVAVYDVSGRLVRALPVQGATTIVWDGRNTNDQPAPSGVYFYRLSMGGQEVTGKVTRY